MKKPFLAVPKKFPYPFWTNAKPVMVPAQNPALMQKAVPNVTVPVRNVLYSSPCLAL